jgi:HK97 family phage major capsid protein
MPVTIETLQADLERQRRDLLRARKVAQDAASDLADQATRAGRDAFTKDESARFDAHLKVSRDAADQIDVIDGKLAEVRQVAAETAANFAAARDTEPTGARRSGKSPTSDDRPRWVRTHDMLPATVERGERFADHEVVAEHAARQHAADAAVTGQHGSFGNLVRAMTTTSGSAVVPTLWASDIIDRARNLSAVMQAGAQVVPMDSKVVQIGRLTVDPTAAFRTEGSTVTASDPTFDNVTLTATTLSALVVGSLEWFADADNVDQVVSEAIAKAIATQIDLVALFGQITTGHEQDASPGNNLLPVGGLPSPNPRGILATLLAVASSSVLGAQTNGTVQTAATFWGEVLDTIYTPRDFNEAPNALIWPSRLARIYAKAADTTNQPLRQPPDVEQITKYISNQIPSGMTQGTGTLMSDLFVGDFNQLLIGQRLGLSVQTLVERYAELGQVGIIAHWRGDIQLARPRAFSVFRYLKGV